MSVAFTRDEDHEAAAANLPDRPVSPHPNLVTPEGLAQLEAAFAEAKAAYTAAQTSGLINEDRTAMARATRDLRYYTARLGSAQRIDPVIASERVVFGCTVTIEREDSRTQTFRIVGEDEADPNQAAYHMYRPWPAPCSVRKLAMRYRSAAPALRLPPLRNLGVLAYRSHKR